MGNSNKPFNDRIVASYSTLTPSERLLADHLQMNPEKILVHSTNEIALECGVSKASVSRFIRKLGYVDHHAVRQALIQSREKGEPLQVSEGEQNDLDTEIRALQQLRSQLAAPNMDAVIQRLAMASSIKIIGFRNSYPLALHLRQQLLQCRTRVDLFPQPGQTISEEIAMLQPDDFVIIIGVRRRTRQFSTLIKQLKKQNTLLITDQSGEKYQEYVEHCLVCQMNSGLPLDNYSVPMSLLAHLSNQTYQYLGPKASAVSQTISRQFSQLEELE